MTGGATPPSPSLAGCDVTLLLHLQYSRDDDGLRILSYCMVEVRSVRRCALVTALSSCSGSIHIFLGSQSLPSTRYYETAQYVKDLPWGLHTRYTAFYGIVDNRLYKCACMTTQYIYRTQLFTMLLVKPLGEIVHKHLTLSLLEL